MDQRIESALERFLAESLDAAKLGKSHVSAEDKAAARAQRSTAAFERLVAQRQALVEGDKWRTAAPFIALMVLAVLGVVAALASSVTGAVGVAITAAIAAMFRLQHVNEQQKARNMVFLVLQQAAKDGKYPPTELVRLLLDASRAPAATNTNAALPQATGSEADEAEAPLPQP